MNNLLFMPGLFVRVDRKMSLRSVLIVASVAQIIAAVGLTGYFSFENGQKAVKNLSDQLMSEVSDRVKQHLDFYLATPHHVNRMNLDAIETGLLDVKDFQSMGKYFWRQIEEFNFTYINFGNSETEFIGAGTAGGWLEIGEVVKPNLGVLYSYIPDKQGNRIRLRQVKKNVNLNDSAWYADAVIAGKPIWTPVYNWPDIPEEIAISASYPVYDRKKQLVGVLGIDLSLSHISHFLRSLRVGKSGKVFIVERSELLIASSSLQPCYKIVEGKARRLKASESSDSFIRATMQDLLKDFGTLQNISTVNLNKYSIDGENTFIEINPYRDRFGLDWLIVVVVPESDFMEQIHANTRATIVLCLVASIGSIVVAILLNRWITQPLLHLNALVKETAEREFHQQLDIKQQNEVGELASSFNQLIAKLQTYFALLKNLNEELAQNESRLNQFLDALPVGVAVHNRDGTVAYFNQTARRLLGVQKIPTSTVEQLVATYQVYVIGTDVLFPAALLPSSRALQGELDVLEELEIHRNKQIICLEVRATPIFDDRGEIVQAIVAFSDINQRKKVEKILADYNRTLETQVAERTAELEKANQELHRLASLDSLTQVANRRRFDEYLSTEWKRSIREKQPLSLILFDVDYFKGYNDCYGHQQGDECLQKLAQSATKAIERATDLIARYGGEEFAAILPNTNLEGAITVATAIQEEIEKLKIPHDRSKVSKYITLSLGISSIVPTHNYAPSNLIAAADEALYEAKNQGRDRFVAQTVEKVGAIEPLNLTLTKVAMLDHFLLNNGDKENSPKQ